MMWHTTGNLTAVKNEAEFDFGVAMLPASKQPASPTGGGNFYLFSGSTDEQKQAALTDAATPQEALDPPALIL